MGGYTKFKWFEGKKMAAFFALHLFAGCIYILVRRPTNMHDGLYWIYRIGALADDMRIKGVLQALPPRILSVTFSGYGYGAPLFYCDVFLWASAALALLGVSKFTCYILLCAAIWSARAGIAFFSANHVLKKTTDIKDRYGIAVLFAFAYSYFPYMIDILLVRGAIGESLASVFFPLIAATLYVTTYEKSKNTKNTILMALGFFGVICSHTISVIIVACCVTVYILGHLKLFLKDKWKFKELFKAGGLAAGLSAFWLFPFLEQYFAHIIPDSEGWWQSSCMVRISDWFISRYYIEGRQGAWYPSTFGILLAAWTVFYFVGNFAAARKMAKCSSKRGCPLFYLIANRESKNRQMGTMLLISWLLCIFMTSRTALEISEGLIGVMQFAWRLLSVVSLLLAIVAVLAFYISSKKKMILVLIYVLYVACFFLSDGVWDDRTALNPYFRDSIPYSRDSADALYIPQGGFFELYEVREEFVDTNLDELKFECERLSEARFWLKYSNNTGNAVVQLPLYYYKGYEAYDVVNQSKLFIEKGDLGLIWVHLDPFEAGEMVVSYVGTKIQMISNLVSLFTWIILAVYIFRRRFVK